MQKRVKQLIIKEAEKTVLSRTKNVMKVTKKY